jgi:hypothetical protein
MRKFLFSAALFVLLLAASYTNSHAQALTFQIVNNTGVTLNNIYVTPNETTNWGNDILPNDMFDAGSTVTVSIPADYGTTCAFDIKITDVPGNYVYFKNVDACKLKVLTIHWDGTYEMQ